MPNHPSSYPKSRDQISVAIKCALTQEADAVEALFDEFYDETGHDYEKVYGDPNAYTNWRIGKHHVVLTHMPGMGNGIASSVGWHLWWGSAQRGWRRDILFTDDKQYYTGKNPFPRIPRDLELVAPSHEQQQQDSLDSLKFPQDTARLINIDKEHESTCQWLFERD